MLGSVLNIVVKVRKLVSKTLFMQKVQYHLVPGIFSQMLPLLLQILLTQIIPRNPTFCEAFRHIATEFLDWVCD